MRRRDFVSRGLALAASTQVATSRPASNLNVLFLIADDLRPELGCYGNELVQSPNIDSLASRSMVFRRAYCQSAVCGPSRASLLTGLRPDTTRVWGNRTHFRQTVPDVITLPQRFRDAGYRTEAIGKVLHGNMADAKSWSVPAWPPGGRQAGMQYIDEAGLASLRAAEPGRVLDGKDIPTLEWTKRGSWQAPDVPDNALQDGQVSDRAVAALRRLRDQRFLLAVGFQKPHLPFTAPRKYFDLYDADRLPAARHADRPTAAPDLAFTRWQELRGYTDIPNRGPLPPGKARELVHGYYAATSYMDAQLGRVLDELTALGLADNTAVVFLGDHGWHLGEQALWAKTTNFEIAARAPLLVHVPGIDPAAPHCDRLVEFVDIFPTLCEACGVSPPDGLEGRSMLPLLDDPGRRWKRAAFSQIPRPYLADQDWIHMGYSIRTSRYRYTEWVDRTGSAVSRELYDLDGGAQGTENLAAIDAFRPVMDGLADQLRAGWRAALP